MNIKLFGSLGFVGILFFIFPFLFKFTIFLVIISLIGFIGLFKFYYQLDLRHWNFLKLYGAFQKAVAVNETKNHTIDRFWDDILDKVSQDKAFIINSTDGSVLTYGEAEKKSNQIASFIHKESGLKANDTIAIYLHNKPYFTTTWIALAKIGIRSSFINFNLKEDALVHSLLVSECKAIIFDLDFLEQVEHVKEKLIENGVQKFYCYGSPEKIENIEWAVDLESKIKEESGNKLNENLRANNRGCRFSDPIIYIFTSGTTGFPKAAKISHYRLWAIPFNFASAVKVLKEDIVYCPLPLYHTAGAAIGTGLSIVSGSTLVLREKFSKTHFLSDIQKYECTVCQYIGEMARYVSLEEEEGSQNNKLRLAIGNGLRREVWSKFKNKFDIDVICEFYGASEGTAGLVNFFNELGAVGWSPPLLPPTSILVKYDEENDKLMRGSDGKCILCKPGEEGHLIQKITNVSKTINFNGYTDKKDTEKKIEYDVFESGDKFYKSGDILKKDYRGYFYFIDRIGDTFRWKGENVSTMEVSSELFKFGQMKEINVFGVQIPNTDGRCGMMVVSGLDTKTFPFDKFLSFAKGNLPLYSIPYFIRISDEMLVTSTFKHKKVEYRKEGFDVNNVKDPIYFRKDNSYVPLDKKTYEDIINGVIKL